MSEQTNPSTTTDTDPEVVVTEEDAEKRLIDALRGTDLERLVAQKEQGIVNPIILARALNVRPQMIYNYIREGRIASVTDNNTQKKVIPYSVALAFAQGYLNRKQLANLKVLQQLGNQSGVA
jgi:hypothetical protein